MKILFGEVEVNEPLDFVTFIDPKYVVSLENVEFAAKKALKAWESGKRISKSLAMEILLYYAATRQIKDAAKIGFKFGKQKVVAVVLDDEKFKKLKFKELDFKPEYDLEATMKHYEITEEELKIAEVEKLPMLIRERIAIFSATYER
ncbi:MAG: KEOPS complex subunit Cgi121 [Archaeoglobaceae archaeon]|nr:KEOPS complex subunit Cgi121 [Archaeoglobaceae archaeon]MCX8151748.1 KEOPS complex subunit Cgi121 [Archaeoglobaceae archaeon]MDW8014282.1 KEOPS complex subunit Cgi121 [Archaeoglobaceae archaeon]